MRTQGPSEGERLQEVRPLGGKAGIQTQVLPHFAPLCWPSPGPGHRTGLPGTVETFRRTLKLPWAPGDWMGEAPDPSGVSPVISLRIGPCNPDEATTSLQEVRTVLFPGSLRSIMTPDRGGKSAESQAGLAECKQNSGEWAVLSSAVSRPWFQPQEDVLPFRGLGSRSFPCLTSPFPHPTWKRRALPTQGEEVGVVLTTRARP